jgi:enoyl-CoA hydratase/carnithine racemase
MENFLLYEKDGAIVTLTMNRPEERNPLTGHFDEFVNACTRINADQSVRCVILTGAGPAFCAGGNVKDMRDKKGIASGSSREIMDGYRNGIQRIPLAFYNLEVPSIAAVNGAAIGAGNDLACMCDIRIASDTAIFAESFVKLGIIPGDGGAWLLPRVVGMSKAAEMTYTGDRIDAKEALACGLVSRVVPAADLMKEARALAGRIAANPGVTLRMSKRLLREGQHTRLDSLLEMSAALQAIAHFTPEHDAAVQAFFEGRSAKK